VRVERGGRVYPRGPIIGGIVVKRLKSWIHEPNPDLWPFFSRHVHHRRAYSPVECQSACPITAVGGTRRRDGARKSKKSPPSCMNERSGRTHQIYPQRSGVNKNVDGSAFQAITNLELLSRRGGKCARSSAPTGGSLGNPPVLRFITGRRKQETGKIELGWDTDLIDSRIRDHRLGWTQFRLSRYVDHSVSRQSLA